MITVAFNPDEELLTFVDTLTAATARPYELVIVNNGDPSPLVDALISRFDAPTPDGAERDGPNWPVRVRQLRHPEGNVGYGRALNYGVANLATHADSTPATPATATAEPDGLRPLDIPVDWIVVANPDIEWRPGALDKLIEVGEELPDAGALGPRIRDEDGTIYPSARAQPSIQVGAGHAVFSRFWEDNPWTVKYKQAARATEASHPVEVGWLSGACLLLRPQAFAEIEGFDAHYFMFFEDVDLGDRLTKAGWRNIYVPAAEVIHRQGASWKHAPEPMIRAHHASAKRFLFDRWHAPWQAPVRGALAVGLKVRETYEVRAANHEREQHQGR